MLREPLTVGMNAPRADAFTKVTGKEQYAADYYPPNLHFPG